MSQFIQTHWTSSGNNWSSVTNHTSHSIIKKTISHGDTSGHAATNQPWSPRGPRGRGGAQTRTPLILVTHKHGNRQCWATPAAGNEVWLFIYCCEVNSRGRVAPKRASVGYVSCEELQPQRTRFLGRRVLSPGISYGRRKGSAGPCHALDPTGKGRLAAFSWVLTNLSEPKPDTLLGPIDNWDSFSARSGTRGFRSLARWFPAAQIPKFAMLLKQDCSRVYRATQCSWPTLTIAPYCCWSGPRLVHRFCLCHLIMVISLWELQNIMVILTRRKCSNQVNEQLKEFICTW